MTIAILEDMAKILHYPAVFASFKLLLLLLKSLAKVYTNIPVKKSKGSAKKKTYSLETE